MAGTPDEYDITISNTPLPPTPGRRRNNPSATSDPTVTDDEDSHYEVLSRWLNTTTGIVWTCIDSSAGSAEWTAGGGDAVIGGLLPVLAAGATYSVDRGLYGAYDLTLSANLTLTPTDTDPPDLDEFREMLVIVRQALSGGPYTLSFGGAITWATPGGVAPAMPTTSGQFISLRFLTVDGAASWIGYVEEDPAMAMDDLSDVTITSVATNDVIKWNGSQWVNGVASTVAALDDLTDVVITAVAAGDGLVYDGSNWVNLPAGHHAHIVGETQIFDGTSTVYYLANEAEQDTVAAYNASGARVAITHDTSDLTKVTFAAAPAAGTGFFDYIPVTA